MTGHGEVPQSNRTIDAHVVAYQCRFGEVVNPDLSRPKCAQSGYLVRGTAYGHARMLRSPGTNMVFVVP